MRCLVRVFPFFVDLPLLLLWKTRVAVTLLQLLLGCRAARTCIILIPCQCQAREPSHRRLLVVRFPFRSTITDNSDPAGFVHLCGCCCVRGHVDAAVGAAGAAPPPPPPSC